MKSRIYKIVWSFVFLFAAHAFFAQEVKVSAVLDSSKIRIGEQVKLDLYVTYNANQKNIKIQWPTVGDTLTGNVDVISVTPIDTTFPDKTNSSKIFQHQQITVSAYDSGYFAIPGFKFVINNDSTNTLYTESFLLEVHTVPTDSSAKKLKDIKPPFEEKFNWRWYSAYIYGGLALLLLIIIVIIVTVYFARKKKQIIIEPEKPRIPAHITALASLERIKDEQAWKDDHVKEYYSSISEAIRLYIEERFNVNALESTTEEIMTAFRSQVVDSASKEKLQQLLMLSDLVKFAKQFPIENEHVFTLQNAFDFVNGTKREEEEMPASEFTVVDPAGAGAAPASPAAQPVPETRYAPPVTQATPAYNSGLRSASPATTVTDKPARKKISRRQMLIIGVGILIMILVYTGLQLFHSKGSQNSAMVEMAVTVNKMCPVMVDTETRLDSVQLISEKSVGYNFTLVNLSASQVDIEQARQTLEPGIINQVKTNPQMQLVRENNITLEYNYHDKTGKFLFSIKVTPQDYNAQS